ncbi:MAG TPA: hypothetical protein VFJ93_07170 [Gaiellaceae bacterium]|nr:hypothetical protein [Gaiellaceae bacterium]
MDRGHRVCLLLEREDPHPSEQAWLDTMLDRRGFTVRHIGAIRKDARERRARRLRRVLEYLHFRGPHFQGLPRYVAKAERRPPPAAFRALTRLPLVRSARGLRLVYAAIAAVERALPRPEGARAVLREIGPDVAVFGDSATRASLTVSLARAATQLGIPTLTWVASWDNLTTRPRLRAIPDRLLVWNEIQRTEAVELHAVPGDRIDVIGAPNFDLWFDRTASSRAAFLGRVGLDPERPVILWVGSATNRWEPPEPPLVERWVAGIRASTDEGLRRAGILIRPHPLRDDRWESDLLAGDSGVAIWPRGDHALPVDAARQDDYYDSIYHSAAVVGINTSAMIEASIVGRPVFTFLDPAYEDSQAGALHFSYLLETNGGVLRVAPDLDRHYVHLAEALARKARTDTRAFLERFVRPRGLHRPVTPIAADAIEATAASARTRQALSVLRLRPRRLNERRRDTA